MIPTQTLEDYSKRKYGEYPIMAQEILRIRKLVVKTTDPIIQMSDELLNHYANMSDQDMTEAIIQNNEPSIGISCQMAKELQESRKYIAQLESAVTSYELYGRPTP